MPMREECKNFESRTYANGETVRKCNLDLAPDAPWRCPDDVPGLRAPAVRRRLGVRHPGQASRSPRRAARPRRRLGRGRARRGRGHPELGRPGRAGRGPGRAGASRASSSASSGASAERRILRSDRCEHLCSPDAARGSPRAGAGCRSCARPPPSGSRAAAAAVDRGGDLALQPHRRARPRRRVARRPMRGVTGDRLGGPGERRARPATVDWPAQLRRAGPTSFAELNAAVLRRSAAWWRSRRAATRRRPDRGRSPRSPSTAAPCFPRLVRRAGEDAEVTVVERFTLRRRRRPGRARWSSCTPHQSARVRYVAVNELGPQVVADRAPGGPRASATRPRCWPPWPSAATTPGCAPTPASWARAPTGDQIAVYFGERPPDARLPHAAGPRRPEDHARTCCSRARCRTPPGASTPASSRCGKEAPGTDAFQTNRNVKLSEDAWAESVPNLEIETNDVRCSHATTVGPDRRGAALLPGEPGRAARAWPSG